MQLIRFTYNSLDIKPNLYLILFFRMCGIYVCERFFNFNGTLHGSILSGLGTDSNVAYTGGYDAEIISVSNEDDLSNIEKHCYKGDMIVVLPEGHMCKGYDIISQWETVKYSGDNSVFESSLLCNIIETMFKIDLISAKTCRTLKDCADIYSKHNILELLYRTKYFYTAKDRQEFEYLIGRYKSIYSDLIAQLRDTGETWGDIGTVNLQYAILWVAYEVDLYCMRNKESLVFKPDSITILCNTMIENRIIRLEFGDSINMLMAQIFDDIVCNKNKAYEYYSELCKGFERGKCYNSYAHYRKAMYFMNYDENYKRALIDLATCISIYPNYTRAWYQIGVCYIKLKYWDRAILAFENAELTLDDRINTNVLRTMEIEYLIKASSLRGDIIKNELHSITRSLDAYKLAEHIWENIEKSQFFLEIGVDDRVIEDINELIRYKQNIQKLYTKLLEVYREIGDRDKEREYMSKMK